MENETKRSVGRPSTQQAKKTQIKRNEDSLTVKEFMALNSGSVFMLMQSGITVYDKDSDRVREIRYCENENSIFKDEQSEASVKSPVVFRMGRLFVPKEQPNLRRFLEVHPGNKSNGGSLFEEVNKEEKAQAKMQDEFLAVDAISLIRTKELDDLLAVALAFGMDIDRPVSEIKHDLLQKAKSNPKVFIDSFDNPIVAMKAKIKQAVSLQLIKADQDAIRWFDTNKVIISVPPGQDPVDIMVRYCLTEAAASLVSEIDRQMA